MVRYVSRKASHIDPSNDLEAASAPRSPAVGSPGPNRGPSKPWSIQTVVQSNGGPLGRHVRQEQAALFLKRLLEEPIYRGPAADDLVRAFNDGEPACTKLFFNKTAVELIVELPLEQRAHAWAHMQSIADRMGCVQPGPVISGLCPCCLPALHGDPRRTTGIHGGCGYVGGSDPEGRSRRQARMNRGNRWPDSLRWYRWQAPGRKSDARFST
jgi:hypothetical protein